MRRALCVLAALAVTGVLAAPAQGIASTDFRVAYLGSDGPAPAAGTPQTYDAVLESSGTPISGAPVTLMARTYESGTSFVPVAHGTTGADGSVEVRAALRYTSLVEWTYAGSDQFAPTTSPGFVFHISSRVFAHALDTTLSRRQPVVVVGRSAPLKPGQRVSLWRGDIPAMIPNQSFTRIAVGRIRADGTFRLAARFVHPGTKRLYVKVAAGSGNDPGYSRYLHIQVR